MLDTQREFYAFCEERQWVWRRKSAGEPRPWTGDPTLARYFFCNVVRRQDTGTMYWFDVLNDLQNRHGDPDLGAIVFHAALYRGFNLIGTHKAIVEAHGGLATTYLDYNYGLTSQALFTRRGREEKVFTGAFMTAGLVNAAKRLTGFREGDYAVAWYFHHQRSTLAKIAEHLSRPEVALNNALRKAYDAFRELPGFGRFLAYQAALDVNYALGGSEDTFTVLGPGADAGLKAIFGSTYRNIPLAGDGSTKKSSLMDLCVKVRDEQPAEWGEHQVEGHSARGRLSLCDIEHSLCEFAKYHRIKHGTGAGTRIYRPGASR